MARVTIEITACDPCMVKGETREATSTLSVGQRSWDVCEEHEAKFSSYLIDLLGDPVGDQEEETGEEETAEDAEREPPEVVITGEIHGYTAAEARRAVEGLGYRIAGHVTAETYMIICGDRPAPHKIREAEEHNPLVLNTVGNRHFARCISAGELTPYGELPQVTKRATKRAAV